MVHVRLVPTADEVSPSTALGMMAVGMAYPASFIDTEFQCLEMFSLIFPQALP